MSFNLMKVLSKSRSTNLAARRMNMFNYPHSYTGVNSALTNVPQNEVYDQIPRQNQVGDKAQFAHQNTRQFPDWYKPYGFNYQGEGWLAFILVGFSVGAYSYFNDIKETKGRRTRKIFPLHQEGRTKAYVSDQHRYRYVDERIAAGDPNWTKFLHKKERAAAHH